MFELLALGAFIGIGGTIAMDLWALLLNRIAGEGLPNWALVGRCFKQLSAGQVLHEDIAEAESYAHEIRLGWAIHYAVGIIYGMIFTLFMGEMWLSSPTFIPAWIFGIVTVGAGWFLLQPLLGLGMAASKTDNPFRVRAMNLAARTVFALGIWAAAQILS